jgi:hypothetical protein
MTTKFDQKVNEDDKIQSMDELNSEVNSLLEAFKHYQSIPGFITFKLNEEKTLLYFEYNKCEREIKNDGKILDENTYDKVRTSLQNNRRILLENKWDGTFKLAKKQIIAHLIKKNLLEDQEGLYSVLALCKIWPKIGICDFSNLMVKFMKVD